MVSVNEGIVGCGSCAAFILHIDKQKVGHSAHAAGKRVHSSTCKMEGIVLGLDLLVKYLDEEKHKLGNAKKAHIFRDCSVAADQVVNRGTFSELADCKLLGTQSFT